METVRIQSNTIAVPAVKPRTELIWLALSDKYTVINHELTPTFKDTNTLNTAMLCLDLIRPRVTPALKTYRQTQHTFLLLYWKRTHIRIPYPHTPQSSERKLLKEVWLLLCSSSEEGDKNKVKHFIRELHICKCMTNPFLARKNPPKKTNMVPVQM